MKIRKDDEVLVITGDDQGKKGKVRRYYPREDRLVVEGANMVKRHMKPRPNVRQAGIVEREAPIHVSDVMLLCPKCSKPARMGVHILEDGKELRACRACGEAVE
jgi:large subunit ribosomal protein L24